MFTRFGNLECVEALMQACPVPLNDDDIDDMTPLLLASENGHHRVVRFLIKMGAEIETRFVSIKLIVYLFHFSERKYSAHTYVTRNCIIEFF